MAARADVMIYPAPAGGAITGDYTVTMNGKTVEVYAAQSEFFQGDYYFASLDLSGNMAIQVTSTQSLENVQVQIKRNFLGVTTTRMPHTTWNDYLPVEAIHLPDGNLQTCWLSCGQSRPDAQPVCWKR